MKTLIPLLLLSLSASAVAQLSEKQAVADLKSVAKSQLAAFKASGKSALAQLDADLGLLETLLGDVATPEQLAQGAANAAVKYVTAVNDSFDGALDAVDVSVFLALLDLEGLQPRDLLVGTGGALDAARAGLLKAAVKLEASARKRLTQFAGFAEKHWSVGLSFDLRLPVKRPDSAPCSEGTGGVALGAVLDLMVGCSSLDQEGDGWLIVAGCCDNTFSDPDVELGISGAETGSDSVDPAAQSGRFQAVFGPLPEGNYSAWAKQGTGPFATSEALGVR